MNSWTQLEGDGTALDSVALEAVRYDAASGLVPVVVQDHRDGNVLMVAYANREALKRTLATGQGWFWSRSRKDYWRKGETSGNVLVVKDVRVDCDGDTVLYLVEAAGPACHTGADSCFYRRVRHASPSRTDGNPAAESHHDRRRSEAENHERVALAEHTADAAVLDAGLAPLQTEAVSKLWDVICERDAVRPAGAYTTYLFEQGVDKVAKKVGEEAVEVAIAAKNAVAGSNDAKAAGRAELANESADLLYHLLVLWKTAGLSPHLVSDILLHRAQS